MKYSLRPARAWNYAELARYNKDLTAAMAKLAARFPDDICLPALAENIACGRADLWLILDESENFVAFLTTETETAASGKKRLLLLELAGRGGLDLTALLPELEAYGRAIGAAEICPYGRLGWSRGLARAGYKIATVKYIKEL